MARKCYASHYVADCDEATVTKNPLTRHIIGCMKCKNYLPKPYQELICTDVPSTNEKAAPTSAGAA